MVRGSELLHTAIAPSSQRDVPYQVSALQTPITLSSAQTPSMVTVVPSSGSLSSPTRLPSASLQPAVQMSFTSTLTSPARLPQSHKRLRTNGGKTNVNPNSNVSNSVIASSSFLRIWSHLLNKYLMESLIFYCKIIILDHDFTKWQNMNQETRFSE